ncbi:hypothetical protein Tco_0014200 [Tanacetum coccineum]
MDGQSERTIQTLEDMLRACVIDFGETTDKVVLIKERLKVARDHQKSYTDNRRKPLMFEVGDLVLLKVSPWKGVLRFGKKGKLAPRYVRPFEILESIGLVAYRLRLPQELSSVHDIFHVSNLKKCLADANLHVPFEEIKVDKTLRFVKEPVEIMDREVKKLKRSRIPIVKVRWNSKRGPEFTREREDFMKANLLTISLENLDIFKDVLEYQSCLEHEHEHVVVNLTQLEWVDSKNLLDRVSNYTSLFSLPEHLKADNTIRVNQLVTILLIESSIHLLDQDRYPIDTRLIHIESRKSPIAVLFDNDTRRISIRHCLHEMAMADWESQYNVLLLGHPTD